jgi:hypothetical protein
MKEVGMLDERRKRMMGLEPRPSAWQAACGTGPVAPLARTVEPKTAEAKPIWPGADSGPFPGIFGGFGHWRRACAQTVRFQQIGTRGPPCPAEGVPSSWGGSAVFPPSPRPAPILFP